MAKQHKNRKFAIDKFLHQRKQDKNLRSFSYNAEYAFIFDDSEKYHWIDYHYCAAGIRSYFQGNKDNIDCLIWGVMKERDISNDDKSLFYEWLLNHSPFKDVFISKQVEEGEYLLVDVRATSLPMLAGGLMASRLPWENYSGNNVHKLAHVWAELVKRGVHPDFAFSYSHALTSDDKTLYLRNVTSQHMSVTIVPYAGMYYDDNHLAFIKHDLKKSWTTYHNSMSWCGPSLLFPNTTGKSKITLNIWAQVIQEFVTSKKSKNIFAGGAENPSVPLEQGIDCLAKILKQSYKEIMT